MLTEELVRVGWRRTHASASPPGRRHASTCRRDGRASTRTPWSHGRCGSGNSRFTVFLCVLVCSDGFRVPISSGSLGKLHGMLLIDARRIWVPLVFGRLNS